MTPIIEPIICGLCVSLFNKLILNNPDIIGPWCYAQTVTVEHDDNVSSSNTTLSDISFDEPHIHVRCH